ncbi:Non-heme 11 kDa protein of cytochrome bc1 complex [Wolfiporia cocos MD-104 SS10]|uniref:Non-heme 11 kDa protein of cytochrome bc1 complex n=1 Tax=Wolfiporia cocos (strain MD-104) TaxID=742152 RepID=A0A2H3JM55_WOLCO|nr:Non-heme 11 kDa protein of cytochrome bc1 complex [Wolfiporia cocos MD-104 SS10]
MSITEYLSSLFPVAHADAPEEKEEETKEEESTEETEEAAEEEEEEEPEDILPALRDECAQSAKCAAATKHFQHCEEKVNAGKGFPHEDCVEEFMMHCVDGCVAPKLFAKLK